MGKYSKPAPFRVGDKVNLSKRTDIKDTAGVCVEKVSLSKKKLKRGKHTFGKLVTDLIDTIYVPFIFNVIGKVLTVLGILVLCLIIWGISFGFIF